MSEKAGEKKKAQGESGNSPSGGSTFVTGGKGKSGHIDERSHADKNDYGKRLNRLNQSGRRACSAEKSKRIEEAPAESHRNNCGRGFLMEDGIADDAYKKRGSEKRDNGRGEAEGYKAGRSED